ncbi:MAG: hypothetical protein ABI551_23215 [Polyangiaceae bacterium]
MSGVRDMEVGRILPRFVTPTDVRDLKNRLDAFVRAEDAAVNACPSIPAGPRAGWKAFAASWRDYFGEDDSWLRAGAQMDEGQAYEEDLGHWQDTLATYACANAAAPRVSPLDPPSGGHGDDRDPSSWQGTVKTVAVAGMVIAVALGLRAVAR